MVLRLKYNDGGNGGGGGVAVLRRWKDLSRASFSPEFNLGKEIEANSNKMPLSELALHTNLVVSCVLSQVLLSTPDSKLCSGLTHGVCLVHLMSSLWGKQPPHESFLFKVNLMCSVQI